MSSSDPWCLRQARSSDQSSTAVTLFCQKILKYPSDITVSENCIDLNS